MSVDDDRTCQSTGARPPLMGAATTSGRLTLRQDQDRKIGILGRSLQSVAVGGCCFFVEVDRSNESVADDRGEVER